MNANALPPKKEEHDPIVFWADDPNVLLNSVYIFEFYPTQTMSPNQKLNALSRTIIILTIISFLFTRSISLLIISSITLASIYFLHKSQMEESKKENFTTPAQDYLTEKGIAISENIFQEPSIQNPFSNVLMTDFMDNPQKKPAPPLGKPIVRDEVLIQAKKVVAQANSGQPNIVDKLFKDVNEQLSFEQSMRQFHSTANTVIPNDQESFLDFCYGGMTSCREGNLFACAKNTSRYTNY